MNALVNFKNEGSSSLAAKARQALITYFSSGWVFFLPYLATYLLYAWLRWPIHHAEVGSQQTATNALVPSLIQVYWVIHAIHFGMAGIAFFAWWRHRPATCTITLIFWSLMPWGLLAALIWLPGVYLEMPSDPWAHFSRINHWANVATVLENTEWIKSGSFFAFSLCGKISSPVGQLRAFDVFYTTCCLLYCWQYFRLSRTLGLPATHALVAVLVNFLMFGNNVFGFLRYYGMSTTVLSQIGVMAFCRGLIVILGSWQQKRGSGVPQFFYPNALVRILSLACAATVFIALNHVQGIAISGILIFSLLSYYVFSLGTYNQRKLYLLGLILVNVFVLLLWPRHSNIDSLYRQGHWLHAWYGFNLFDPGSPAFERSIQVLGGLGIVNLLAGVFLVWKRHIIGWLTVSPIVILLMPVSAIPFADIVSRTGPLGYEYILSFNRLFLSIPAGLALCKLAPIVFDSVRRFFLNYVRQHLWQFDQYIFSGSLNVVLLTFLLVPAASPYFNRFWNQLAQVPQDLSEQHIITNARHKLFIPPYGNGIPNTLVLSTPGTGFVIDAFGTPNVAYHSKWMNYPKLSTPVDRLYFLHWSIDQQANIHSPVAVVVPHFESLISPKSLTGYLSGHWYSQQIALEQSGTHEIGHWLAPHFILLSSKRGVEIFGKDLSWVKPIMESSPISN